MEEVLVTSGGMSNLLNKLIESKLIIKRKGIDKEDARSAFIKLTPKGLAIVDKAMEVQAACERKLTQALTATEKQQLSKLLKKMGQEDDV
jgi:DNA-binding MarR family transcriptional regulator